jgi:hypothetical protein
MKKEIERNVWSQMKSYMDSLNETLVQLVVMFVFEYGGSLIVGIGNNEDE